MPQKDNYFICEKGFTLVELLIVVAIIGILASIAIPAYIGQREKAKMRAVVSSARGAVGEIQAVLTAFIDGGPYLLLDDSGKVICIESSNATLTNSTCKIYFDMPIGDTYSDISDIITDIIKHHEGKGEYSPYDPTQPLFVEKTGAKGVVVINSLGERRIRIHAYGENLSNPIFDTFVTSR